MHVSRLAPTEAPPTAPFFTALREGRGRALSFLEQLPATDDAWREVLARDEGGIGRTPPALVERLVERQRVLGTGRRAEAAAGALGDPSTRAVVTGQQPGLLGGPLMNFHKIAGAIALARRLDGEGGRRVVPVFWLASEDHDFNEANQLVLLDGQGQPRRLSLPQGPDGRSLMHVDVPVEASDRLVEEVASILPSTDRARQALDLVRREPGDDFATWCARCVARLLGDDAGLVILEPPFLLPYAGPALARLVRDGIVFRDALAATGTALERAGLPAPLSPRAGELPLFVRAEERGPRQRVVLEDDRLYTRDRASSWRPDELASLLASHPALGSGDAAGRVFVQNRLLPVLGYVGGPSELAYHAQVRAAHHALDLPYPLALPRPEATWVDAKAEASAAAFGCTIEEVVARRDCLDEAPTAAGSEALSAELDAWVERWAVLPPALQARLEEAGEGARALEKARARLEAEVRRLRKTVEGAFARDAGVGAARRRRLEDLVRPRGRPQERVLSPLSLVARFGVEAFREGLEALEPLAPGHAIVHLP